MVKELSEVLGVCESNQYAQKARRRRHDGQRLRLRAKVTDFLNKSPGAAGRRTLQKQLRLAGFPIGRFKVCSLMREAGLRSGQPGPRPYKKHGQARVDIPNLLDLQFDVPAPNRVWCGDISYVWQEIVGTTWPWFSTSATGVSLAPRSVRSPMPSL